MSIPSIPGIPNVPNWVWVGGAIVAGYIILRPREAASGAVGVAGDIASGAIEGAGSAIKNIVESTGDLIQTTIDAVTGIPKTDEQKCKSALADGRSFDASLYCPAGTFITETVKDIFNVPKQKTPAVLPQKPKPKATAPGGGFISNDPNLGPSFSDVINDPYGLGMSVPNYFMFDSSDENSRNKKAREITIVGGIRG